METATNLHNFFLSVFSKDFELKSSRQNFVEATRNTFSDIV